MHRAQILVPDEQWQAIKLLATRQNKSVGELIRQYLVRLTTKELRYNRIALDKLCGFISDTSSASSSIDATLYGKKPKSQ